MGNNVVTARHAVAIDEQREDFAPTLWNAVAGVDLKQVWFAGVHSDVGGSYAPDRQSNTVASDVPLSWMIGQAKKNGLMLEPHITTNLSNGTLAPLHKSRRHIYRFRDRLHRELIDPERPTAFHSSVRTRYENDPKYRPRKLKALIESVGWSGLSIES